jgi:transcription elongation factor Elf1
MIWLQEKYLLLISASLPQFKKRSQYAYSFRCPYCGDSKKSKTKARGNIYSTNGNELHYHCFNCGTSRSFEWFLRDQSNQLYGDYKIENMKEGGSSAPSPVSKPKPKPKTKSEQDIFKTLPRISDLNVDHPAKRFVIGRQIPGKFHGILRYTPLYASFVNSIIPNKITGGKDGPRLVIPYYSYGNKLSGFQGRALDANPVRYIHTCIDETLPRAFNLNKVDMNQKFYVTEGPIDSMFLENAIAAGNADLTGCVRKLNANKENCVIVFDNEPRSEQIVEKMYQAIRYNFSVVVWPKHLTQKDINDMILAGYTTFTVQELINRNTFKGLQAELAMASWKKVAA